MTFCQANFKLMDADLVETARHFGERIAFIHVRDVEGTKEDFTELFHDQGTTDQFALMRVYRELGLDVPVREVPAGILSRFWLSINLTALRPVSRGGVRWSNESE